MAMRSSGAGKGCAPRPVKKAQYDKNFSNINWSKKPTQLEVEADAVIGILEEPSRHNQQDTCFVHVLKSCEVSENSPKMELSNNF